MKPAFVSLGIIERSREIKVEYVKKEKESTRREREKEEQVKSVFYSTNIEK